MAVEVEYPDKEGKQKKFVLEEGDDTNLLLGYPKSIFTVLRSNYSGKSEEGKEIQAHEYWVKVPTNSNALSWMLFRGDIFYNARYYYPNVYKSRPISHPKKIVFDSLRTSMSGYFDGNFYSDYYRDNLSLNDTVGNWTYLGSTDDLPEKDFDIYGYAIKTGYGFIREKIKDISAESYEYILDIENVEYKKFNFMFAALKDVADTITANYQERTGIYLNPYWVYDEGNYDYYDGVLPAYFGQYPVMSYDEWEKFFKEEYDRGNISYSQYYNREWYYAAIDFTNEIVFGDCIAEVRNWEIISNNTPEQNTYYVAIENKKGELLDVKTTTTFGVTVGSVASEFADRMSESQKNTRVVDDLVIRI